MSLVIQGTAARTCIEPGTSFSYLLKQLCQLQVAPLPMKSAVDHWSSRTLSTGGSLLAPHGRLPVAETRNVLSLALDRFGGQTLGSPLWEGGPDRPTTIASVRNALEHGQNLAIRGGLLQ